MSSSVQGRPSGGRSANINSNPTHHKSNPKNSTRKPQRIRLTNKALESQQFSTLRLPRKGESVVPKVNVDAIFADLGEGGSGGAKAANFAFDPIPDDGMFDVVEKSAYWPPPSLAALVASTGIAVEGGDGFDSYNRLEDDAQGRERVEKVKKIVGELNHPRGKPRQNKILKLEPSSASEDDEEETEK
ncbi:unnamed protein product [Phytomonas sp. Hart1]|nr:unnamed protein product [Phytomonas sp. Hart1]|eukprot:CCW71710.1 unnamed protein product [Phytomonas sp. isolate Hart1]